MSRGGHPSIGKRQRQAEKARKKREKLERRMQKRDEPTQPIPITTADTIVGNLPPIEDAMDAIHQELDPSFVPEGAEEGEGAAEAATGGQPTRLFVGRLSWDTDSDGLREAFGEIGPVLDAVVVLDRDTGKSRGFGFVTMGDRKSAKRAIDELGDAELDGRNIVVSFATER